MSIIPKVAKKPITKPKPEAKKPIIKPKQVAKKPKETKRNQKKPRKLYGGGIEKVLIPLPKSTEKGLIPLPKATVKGLIPLPPIAESKPLRGVCSRILTPTQVGPICWFTSTFIAMFYSQRSRKILQKASKNLNLKRDANVNSPAVFVIEFFKKILNDKYMKKNMDDAEYNRLIDDTFKDETFGDILKNLHTLDGTLFPFNPSIHRGYASYFYMVKLELYHQHDKIGQV